jgi:hypothetical protein
MLLMPFLPCSALGIGDQKLNPLPFMGSNYLIFGT